LPPGPSDLPGDVRAFLREADRRVERFQAEGRCPAFVPSDYPLVYGALRAVDEAGLAPGRWFCEWGSGFGVVACLAALLGFEACGIEAEPELVEAARTLAGDFDLPVEFAHGSFLPAGPGPAGLAGEPFAWLTTDARNGYDVLGLDPGDFHVVFAYPWPDEERLTAEVFGRHARPGALLVTYHGGDELRLRRQARRR
jgi:hypothetical protein